MGRGEVVQRYRVVEALGLTVVQVPRLRKKIVMLPDHDLALVRADLDDDEHEQAEDWLIRQALDLSRPCA